VNVLVVDAAAAVRSRLVALLVEGGVTVVGEAATSAHARELAGAHAPDAIVLDVDLPDRGGLALIEDFAPHLRIVVLTNEVSYRRRCIMLGAHVFLDKSSDFASVAGLLTARSAGSL
jgi:DNA-binding NarL/FixJ family response regulator